MPADTYETIPQRVYNHAYVLDDLQEVLGSEGYFGRDDAEIDASFGREPLLHVSLAFVETASGHDVAFRRVASVARERGWSVIEYDFEADVVTLEARQGRSRPERERPDGYALDTGSL